MQCKGSRVRRDFQITYSMNIGDVTISRRWVDNGEPIMITTILSRMTDTWREVPYQLLPRIMQLLNLDRWRYVSNLPT